MDEQAAQVKGQISTLFDRLRNQQGQGVDIEGLMSAYEKNTGSHFSKSDVQEALRTGDKNSVFQTTLLDKDGKAIGEAASSDTMMAYLSEMGCKPEGSNLVWKMPAKYKPHSIKDSQ